jgi:hypothetical protein
MEQRDRSLTVIIPRAKFHAGSKQNLIDVEAYKSKSSSSLSVNQTKLINYLDASPSPSKNKNVCQFSFQLSSMCQIHLSFLNLSFRMCHVKKQTIINHKIPELWSQLVLKSQQLAEQMENKIEIISVRHQVNKI